MRRALLVCLTLTGLTLAVYARTADHDFIDHHDDRDYILLNRHVQAGLSVEGLAWAASAVYPVYYHPLTWLSHMLDVELFGLWAGGHHLTSVGLHVVNALLVLLVLHRMTGAFWPSAFVAAVFALHPVRVEAVAWIAQRKDMLSTLFWLLTLWAYVAYVRRPGVARYLLVCVPFLLGLLAKPMLVTLPFALLLLDYWPLGRLLVRGRQSVWRCVWEKAPLAAAAVGASAVTVLGASVTKQGIPDLLLLPVYDRLANAVVSYVQYIGMTLWPTGLCIFYPHPNLVGARGLSAVQVLSCAVLLGAITFLAVRQRRRRPYLIVGWLWYLGTLVPMIGLAQAGTQALADRYLYVPQIGLAVMAAWGAAELARSRRSRLRVCAAIGVAAVAAMAVGSWRQVGYWRDSRALFERAAAVTEHNWSVYNKLGGVCYAQGEYANAVEWLERVLTINPESVDAHYNLGLALGKLGRAGAAAHLRRAIALDPKASDAHHALGGVLLEGGEPGEAVVALREAVRLAPENALAHATLGIVLCRLEQHGPALASLGESVRLAPNAFRPRYALGALLVKLGRPAEAVVHLREAARLKPLDAPAHAMLGAALGRSGDVDGAIESLTRAVRLDPERADAHTNLAGLLIRRSCHAEAIDHARQALALTPDSLAAHRNLGLALAAVGQFEKALYHLVVKGRLKPNHPTVRRVTRKLRLRESGE